MEMALKERSKIDVPYWWLVMTADEDKELLTCTGGVIDGGHTE
jgi:hypothetical protein